MDNKQIQETYSKEEILELAEKIKREEKEKEKIEKKGRRKMKTGKKALYSAIVICITILFFTMAMIYLEKDTGSLSILATASVGILPVMYGIYDFNSTKINLKHMEENYIPNYDDKQGIY